MQNDDQDNNLWRDRNKIFVAGVDGAVTDNEFYAKFESFGELFQAKIVYDKNTQRSRGFGFVTFAQYESCLDAIEALDQQQWKGKKVLNVRFLNQKADAATAPAPRTKLLPVRPEGCSTVYVGNIPYEISEDCFRKLFSRCGGIRKIRFCEDIRTHEFRGFGYVEFLDEDSTEKAVKTLHEFPVMGRLLKVDYASTNTGGGPAAAHADQMYGGSSNTYDNNHSHHNNPHQNMEMQKKKLKKGLCHKFQQGLCTRGDDCKFAHLILEEEQQPENEPIVATTSTNDANDEPVVVAQAQAREVSEETDAPSDDSPLCQNYQKGKCKRGKSCRFRHVRSIESDDMMNAKDDSSYYEEPAQVGVCRNFLQGSCNRGTSCRFSHPVTNTRSEAISQPGASFQSEKRKHNRSNYNERFQSICYNWQKSGSCARGDACSFSHSSAEKKSKH